MTRGNMLRAKSTLSRMVEIIEQRHEREIVIARKWRTSRQADTYRKGL
jgi:hypothetical protein